MKTAFEELNWPETTKVLVILAHPDDPEFFMGGTLAYWHSLGYHIDYLLLTQGGRGQSERYPDETSLKEIRKKEQRAAANVLGVHDVTFFNEPDGYLANGPELQKRIVRHIRALKPDIVVSSDPLLYYRGTRLNHHDHRMAGEITAQAVFPAVRNRGFFPELLQEGYPPHHVKELWFSLCHDPNISLDVSLFWDARIRALKEHVSQIEDIAQLETWLRRFADELHGEGKYLETFRRLVF